MPATVSYELKPKKQRGARAHQRENAYAKEDASISILTRPFGRGLLGKTWLVWRLREYPWGFCFGGELSGCSATAGRWVVWRRRTDVTHHARRLLLGLLTANVIKRCAWTLTCTFFVNIIHLGLFTGITANS